MDAQFWNTRYKQDGYLFGLEPNTFLKSAIHHLPKAGNVLCLAEGEGRNAVFLSKLGYTVCAIDISSIGKEKAEKLASDNGVSFEYIVTDVNDFDFGQNKWDAIISISAHNDSHTRDNIYPKIVKSLKTGGVFLLESYHPKQLGYGTGGPKDASWLVTLEDMQAYFPNQTILHKAELERDVTEGTSHTGKAFVTQFICRKTSSN